MTTYVSVAVVEESERELGRHLAADISGRCLTCRELEPCSRRAVLYAMFNGINRLPRR